MVSTLGQNHSMEYTNSFLKRFESSSSTIKHKRSCQRALVGFCLGHCCGPLYEKTSQMRLRCMHTPSWKEKRIKPLQFIPQTGNISASNHYNNIKLEEMYSNVPIKLRGGDRRDAFLPCVVSFWFDIPPQASAFGIHFSMKFSLAHS